MQGFQELRDQINRSLEFQFAQFETKYAAGLKKLQEKFETYQRAAESKIAEVEQANAKLEASNAKLTERVDALEHGAEVQERRSRGANVVMVGVPEGSDSPSEIVSKYLPQVPQQRVLSAERLGLLQEGAVKGRPVLVKLMSVQDKHNAFAHSKALRPKKVFLDGDLTPQQKATKAALGDKYRLYKAQNKRPYWRYDTLYFYEGNQVHKHGSSQASHSNTQTHPPSSRPSQIPGPPPRGAPRHAPSSSRH